MLAARDQENLVHGHQAAAASKPLNQGAKQVAPKTPGNKVSKTPFKLRLNDENVGLGGRTGLKANGRGNENLITGAKKGGPRTRAPLGAKTTNAKAKALQTPAPQPVDNDLGKPIQKSASARKPKPRVSHAEMTKLEVLGDKDELEEREIEYMPPRGKDMPDFPDDHFQIDTSLFENGGLMSGAFTYFQTREGEDGLSHVERDQQRRQKQWDIMDRKDEAKLQRDFDGMNIPCTHYPECPGDVCKDTVEARKAAEEQYQKTIAEIDAETAPKPKKPAPTTRPSTLKSRSAAAALSQSKTTNVAPKMADKGALQPIKSRVNPSLVSKSKKHPVPTNPSSMRHTAAVAASKTTMGYAKGRSTSATLRNTILPKKEPDVPDTSLAPAVYIERYGVPRLGSEMWFTCQMAGCFDEDEEPSLEDGMAGDHPHGLDKLIREEAEQDFQLTF